MRFVWAVAAFVLAALMIGAGVAQRTVFQGPKTESQAIEVVGDAPYVLVDGAVLNSHDGAQTLRVQDDGSSIFVAYGRTADITEWLSKADYTRIGEDGGEITSTAVAASDPPAEDAAPLSPVGSDLWLYESTQENVAITPLQLPADMSLLVATDGTAPAPGSLSLSWPTRTATPWAGPLIVGGSILLAGGIVLYILGLRHARRARGPRRKGLPMPVTEPIELQSGGDLSDDAADKGVITAAPTRRQITRGRKAFVVVPALAVSALVFSGCSADAWPELAATPTPTPTSTVVVPEGQGSPAVTEAQAERIVARIADQVATADEARDATAAAQRLDGTALATRTTNYTLMKDVKDQEAMPAIPQGPLRVTLPEAVDGWPRTFLAVVTGSGDAPDTIMSVTQQDAWSPYKLTYLADLVAEANLNLAPAYVGAISIAPDSPFLVLPPDEVAAAYADILTNGDDSAYADKFDAEGDTFRTQVADSRTDRLKTFNETGSKTGKLTFAASAGTTEPAALATLDSGAIVAVTVDESDTVTPTNTDAVIKVDKNPVVKALAGVTQSATGFTTTFADQLFFFVPAQSSNERIQLLGYSSDILNAKVAPK